MKRRVLSWMVLFAVLLSAAAGLAQQSEFRVLAFYSAKTEPDHVQFAEGALEFFKEIAARDHFTFDASTNWDDLNSPDLSKYQLILWLNDFPSTPEQRQSFQRYMEAGGAWLGFHVSAFNDADTHWPWFVDFLGGGVFHINSWPPLPAKLVVDDRTHPVTVHLPESYPSPINEWYIWKPSPRLNKDVRVLVSLDPSNYPLGLKDVLISGDLPVVWTNTKYRMLYMNMGHGDKIFTSSTQNKMFEDAVVWLGTRANHAEAPAPAGAQISPRGVAINTKTNKVYAVNTNSDTVTVIDGIHRASVKVGIRPVSIAVNPATNKIYVGNSRSGTVTVIDGASDAAIATLKVGDLPYVVAVNPATNKVYVSRTFSNDMTVIDGASNATSTLEAGVQADAIALNPVNNKLYLTGYEGNHVTVIDGSNDRISKVPVGTHLWGVAVNEATNRIYFANSGSASVAVLDGASNAVTSVGAGEIPCAIAVDPTANKIYAANYASDSVTVIDGSSDKVIATVIVGARPQALAVDRETHRIFVANTRSNNVSVIDGRANSVIATVPAGNSPYAIAVDAARNRVYVTNVAGNNSIVIDGKTLVPAVAPAPQ
ncbi:MAG TPA: ThuA domain-containing protein [Candidatus Sulfotelmatobacter sp.]|nr:ThuA domain-containing protein [Candidatus Sulfotelmatobacter sp.]